MMKRHAFTLVELMVVLAVIAIISTLTFGVISNTVTSNRRATCAANMSQIYGALRLYSQDYDGQFPYFNPVETGISSANIPQTIENGSTPELEMQSGLWRLIRYSNGTKTGYLKSAETLFSPADRSERRATDAAYSSYQTKDDGNIWTYATFRESGSKRQIWRTDGTDKLQRRPSDTTVVLWSRWHRRLDNTTFATLPDPNGNNRDNVLFLDGRVQSLPTAQTLLDSGDTPIDCSGWKRIPRELDQKKVNLSASDCELID